MVGVKTEIRESRLPEDEKLKLAARHDAFSSIAIWQAVAFAFLLCFVWCIEWYDIPAQAFGTAPTPFNPIRVSLLTAGVLAAAVVTIGHTYERQRGLLRKLLETCSYCHRVKITDGHWEHVEVYFIRHYPVGMHRSTCPACEQMLTEVATVSRRTSAALVR